MFIWYWLIHTGGIDEGKRYGTWDWYSFWSGLAGSFLVGIAVWAGTTWAHRTCHVWWCPRRAMFDWTDPQGFSFRLCRKCHPEYSGERITRRHLYLGDRPGPG